MKTIRASEIGTYLYCQRAWWYQKKGAPTDNQLDMVEGKKLHERHGRAVMTGSCLKAIAYLSLLCALALLTIYLLNAFLN